MESNRLLAVVLALVLTMCLALSNMSCSEDEDTPAGPVNDAADVNSYLTKLPSWEQFANVADTADVPVGDAIADMSNLVLCTTTPRSITQNPEAVVTFGSAPDVMYLGSLIQGDTYLGGLGSMEELPIRQRAPLTIALKLFTGTDITRTVDKPDAASIQSALN